MTDKVTRILELLESWERGYISPSAQAVMRDAKELIREQEQIICDLQSQLAEKQTPKKRGKS